MHLFSGPHASIDQMAELTSRCSNFVLLSTDPGGIEADLASPDVWSKLIDTSGTPNEQARRLLFLLFPNDVAESFYRNSAISWQRRARNYRLNS